MNKTLAAVMLGGALLAPIPAFADIQSDIQARYAGLKAAMDEREDKAIKSFLTKDFQSTDISGEKLDADDMITRLAMMPDMPGMKTEVKLGPVTVDGTTARVTQTRDTQMSRVGRDGATHQMEMIQGSNDVWVEQKGQWLLQSTEVQEMAVKRDGVEMRHFHKGDVIPKFRRGGPGEGRPGGEGSPPPAAPPAG